jgi:DNA-binding NtrC family response regulator
VAKILIIDERLDWWTNFKLDLEAHHVFKTWPVDIDIADYLKKEEYEIILLSFQLKRCDSFTLLKQINQVSPQTPVIGLSDLEEADLIVRAVKKGAFDVIIKPFLKEKMLLAIERGLENRHLRNEIDYLKREQDIIYDFNRIIAFSPSIKRMISTLKKFSQTDSTILITGAPNRLSRSTAPTSPRRCSRASCSVMKRGPSPAPTKPGWAGSNRPRTGRFFSMKSVK